MIVIAWLFVILLVVGAVIAFAGEAWNSRFLRPYAGLLIVALLVAVIGSILGWIAPELTAPVMTIGKWIAVAAGVGLCVHVIVRILGAVFVPR